MLCKTPNILLFLVKIQFCSNFFFCSKFSILFYPYTGHIFQWVGTRWERVCILKESRVLTGGGHKWLLISFFLPPLVHGEGFDCDEHSDKGNRNRLCSPCYSHVHHKSRSKSILLGSAGMQVTASKGCRTQMMGIDFFPPHFAYQKMQQIH